MTSLTSLAPAHVIGLLLVKITALSVAITLSEQQGRDLIPLVAVIYAIALPVMLWCFGP
ncbi:MAG: hypothetical protein AAGH74_05200 [Pseudomonadota bacterium]